jgi:hypothetical protein
MVYHEIGHGGGIVSGYVEQAMSYTNPTRLTHHRFQIGGVLYVPYGNRYMKQIVQGVEYYHGHDFWETNLGSFPDRLVLSPDEHREWSGGRQ